MTLKTPTLNAGWLDRRVQLMRPVYNSFGDEIIDWEVAAEVWAAVLQNTLTEVDEAGHTVGRTAIEVTIRYRDGIDNRFRVVDRGRTYEIRGMADVASLRTHMQLLCQEVL